MNQMTMVKRSIITAVCIALCIVLPMLFHGIPNAGAVFLPMHIPVYICGLICGWQFGLLCGLAGPGLSCLLTGMPPVPMVFLMMIELSVYGVTSGLMMKLIHTGKVYGDLYVSQIIAMVVGRVIAAVCSALIFFPSENALAAAVASYVVASWPGTLIQLALIPSVIFALMKARLVPERYPEIAED